MSDIVDKVRELSRIKADIAKLNDRRKELEAYFLERGGDDVVDTKFKSTVYADPDSQAAVTYTEAQALTIVYPHYLKETLGAMFPDIFEESVKTEIKPKNKDIERMLIGMFTGNYTRSTPEEIIAQLPCGDKAKSALAKKLKGAKFETDRDNLMKSVGFRSRTPEITLTCTPRRRSGRRSGALRRCPAQTKHGCSAVSISALRWTVPPRSR